MKIIGAYGCKAKDKFTTCFQVSPNILIDAGNIMELGEDAKQVDYIFLTHSHLDHICDIPFLIDNFFSDRTKPIYIFGLKDTLNALKKYIFNWNIWPDFNQIDLLNKEFKAIEFEEISENQIKQINGIEIESIKSNHTVPTLGYIINKITLFTGDTYKNEIVKNRLNSDLSIKNLIIDVSFPSRMETLAKDSKHLTPKLLKEFLSEIRDDIDIYIYHLKPQFEEEITEELKNLNVKILKKGDEI
jgi:ribonuclease BN (tRNA processing enzyme)